MLVKEKNFELQWKYTIAMMHSCFRCHTEIQHLAYFFHVMCAVWGKTRK